MTRWRLAFCLLSLLSFTHCGGGNDNDSPTSPSPNPPPAGGGSVSVAIGAGAAARTADAFGANPLTVSVGTTVVWTNNDSAPHNAISNNGAFSVATIAPGSQGSNTFTTAGTFPYHCGIHPNMMGTVIVQ